MPLLMMILSASFIAGVVRVVLATIGASLVYFVGMDYVVREVETWLLGGYSGFTGDAGAILWLAGFYHGTQIVLAALTYRITLLAFRSMMLF